MRRRNQQPLPGNDGQWFLDLVGAVPGSAPSPPPEPVPAVEEPSEEEGPSALAAVAALRHEPAEAPDSTATIAPPTTIDLSTSSGVDPHEDEEFSHATQADVAGAATLGVAGATDVSSSEAAPTELLVTPPTPTRASEPAPPSADPQDTPTLSDTWRATPKPPPPADWAAEPLSSSETKTRRSRRPLLLAVAVAALVVAALWLPALVNGRASEQSDEYRTVLVEVRDSLVGAQGGLEAATEPSSQRAELLGVAPQLEPLAVASDSALTIAAEPLPEPLPLLPSGSIDDLVPSRNAVAAVGAEGADIAARIDDTTTYRLLLTEILVVPELPIEADGIEAAALGAELAAIDANSRNAAAQLPSDPALADHKEVVIEAVSGFDEWAAEYLAALTAGDAALAADLIAQLEATQFALANSLVPSLRTVRSEVDDAIVVLHVDATNALAALP